MYIVTPETTAYFSELEHIVNKLQRNEGLTEEQRQLVREVLDQKLQEFRRLTNQDVHDGWHST